MKDWKKLASKKTIERTLKALNANGIEASLAANAAEARQKVLAMLPARAEVFALTSVTLDSVGLAKEINESGRYVSVRNALYSMNQQTQAREMRKLGAAPDLAVGSAHAVTETGTVVVASLTGSQLPSYAYAAGTLIWWALPASVWVCFQVFVFITAEAGVVHMLRGERITGIRGHLSLWATPPRAPPGAGGH